ncbi:MAG: alpha/beta hydrolase domain-containing protein [Myxococcales bacterium]|nr:alpha/beta hydrolase domain-containing protein [Myxococcales bacterium]MDH3483786.1 alpha/beta hydrolase domain-containing protein [Myxococcales bacterium]
MNNFDSVPPFFVTWHPTAARPGMMLRASILCGLVAGMVGCSDDGGNIVVGTPADATVEGPIVEPGVPFVAGTRDIDLGDVGFQQSEYFVSGTAVSYTNANQLSSDGRWRVQEADTADYKTRILVYRPQDANAFSGTVILEWLNVSGGLDAAPDWSAMHTEVLREGHVWVGVSAQLGGIEGSGNFPLGLKIVDPERYGSLSHPGDSFSYEIYSQIAQAVRSPVGIDPLEGLIAEQVIAIGESQSAGRLVTYVNAFAPRYRVFDGYLIHSRGGGSPRVSQSPQAEVTTPEIVRVRDDLEQPVLMFQTESDLLLLNSLPSNQPDSAMFRLWEVAGTAHADVYTLITSNSDLGDDPSVADVVENDNPAPIQCELPINSGPQHWVLKAGLHGLVEWIATGTPLPEAPRLSVTADGDAFQLDELGNVLGGIRTPYVDAPVAVLSGLGQTGEGFCRIFGTTRLFDETQLAELYPTRQAYLGAVTSSTQSAVEAGFILPVDAALIIAAAEASDIGNQ